MKTKTRVRCTLPLGRWASYAAAGAATIAAANDAEAQIVYSGTLNTPVGNSPVAFHTLVSNGHQGALSLGKFYHQYFTANGGFAKMAMNAGGANGQIAGFFANNNATHSTVPYLKNLPAGQKINSLNFNAAHGYMAGTYINSSGGHKNSLASASFRGQGIGYLAFEFNKGSGEQFGWVRVNMTTGAPKNGITLVDYAYGAPGQAIVVGEQALPVPTWQGANGTNSYFRGNWSDPGNWVGGLIPGATTGTTDTDTANFTQSFVYEPNLDTNRNLKNIIVNLPGSGTVLISATGGSQLLLTNGGEIQVASTSHGGITVNAPIVLEGSPNVTTNSYTFANNANLPGSVTLVINSSVSPSTGGNSLTTLNLVGNGTAHNYVDGVLSDGPSGALLAVHVQGGTWFFGSPTASDTYSGVTTIDSGSTVNIGSSVSVMSQSMNIVNSGALNYTGGNQKVGTVTGSGSVTVNGGTLTAYQIRQNSLTIVAGETVTLTPSGSGSTSNPANPNNINFSSSLTSLTIAGGMNAWTGTLDIGNNGLVIAYGNPANDPYAAIDNMIESGYNGGVWGGKGITSTIAAASIHTGTPLNIGLLDFTPGTGNYSTTTFIVFQGQTVTTNAILVRLTYMDDLVLAGDMSQNNATSDALLFAANYGSGTTWAVGDLTHDGVIDSNDALLFAANYVVGLPSLDGTSGGDVALGDATAAVPEPASLGLLAIGAVGLLSVRRRRSRKARPAVGPDGTAESLSSDGQGPTASPLIAGGRLR